VYVLSHDSVTLHVAMFVSILFEGKKERIMKNVESMCLVNENYGMEYHSFQLLIERNQSDEYSASTFCVHQHFD
jgi:hypothetical protein